jgi:hypothetical protein
MASSENALLFAGQAANAGERVARLSAVSHEQQRCTSKKAWNEPRTARNMKQALLSIVVSARGGRTTTPRYEFTQGDHGGLDDVCSAIRRVL